MTALSLIYLFIMNLVLGFCFGFDTTRKNWKEALFKAFLFAFLSTLAIFLNSNLLPRIAEMVSNSNPVLSSWLSNQWVTFFTILLIIVVVFLVVRFLHRRYKRQPVSYTHL